MQQAARNAGMSAIPVSHQHEELRLALSSVPQSAQHTVPAVAKLRADGLM